MIVTSTAGVGRALDELAPVWVRLVEYRMTHGYLHLGLSDGERDFVAHVYFVDCASIHGPTSGGPWRCKVSEQADEGVVFDAGEGALKVVAGRVSADFGAAGTQDPDA